MREGVVGCCVSESGEHHDWMRLTYVRFFEPATTSIPPWVPVGCWTRSSHQLPCSSHKVVPWSFTHWSNKLVCQLPLGLLSFPNFYIKSRFHHMYWVFDDIGNLILLPINDCHCTVIRNIRILKKKIVGRFRTCTIQKEQTSNLLTTWL
jgi:hypothetical protein